MKSFFQKDSYTIEDIISLVKNKVDEGTYLEFKRGEALTKSKADIRKDISTDVTAFANADGGIIIYGIDYSDETGPCIPDQTGPLFI